MGGRINQTLWDLKWSRQTLFYIRSNYDWLTVSLVSTLYPVSPVENAQRDCSAGFLINGTWKGAGQIQPVSPESSTSFDVFTFLAQFAEICIAWWLQDCLLRVAGATSADLVNEITECSPVFLPTCCCCTKTQNWISLFTGISPTAMMNELFSFLFHFHLVLLQIYQAFYFIYTFTFILFSMPLSWRQILSVSFSLDIFSPISSSDSYQPEHGFTWLQCLMRTRLFLLTGWVTGAATRSILTLLF